MRWHWGTAQQSRQIGDLINTKPRLWPRPGNKPRLKAYVNRLESFLNSLEVWIKGEAASPC